VIECPLALQIDTVPTLPGLRGAGTRRAEEFAVRGKRTHSITLIPL